MQTSHLVRHGNRRLAVSIAWGQTAGTPVTPDRTNELTPSFTAPSVDSSEILAFEATA